MLTVLAEVEVVLNNHPLTYDYAEELECSLTPNHLLFGRTLELEASSDETSREHSNLTLTKRSKFLNMLLEFFWSRWRTEYITSLREYYKSMDSSCTSRPTSLVRIIDVVTVFEKHIPRARWRVGRVIELVRSKDGQCKGARVKLAKTNTEIMRPVNQLYPLEVIREIKQMDIKVPHTTITQDISTVRSRPKRVAAYEGTL